MDEENDGNAANPPVGGTDEATNRDFTEITNESYGEKMGDACSGTCTGLFLFVGSIGLLIFNEGRTVKRAKDLAEGRDTVLSTTVANVTRVDAATSGDNRLVHIVADVGTDDIITDSMFGVVATAASTANGTNNANNTNNTNASTSTATSRAWLKLRRSVEMYQWHESTRTQTTKHSDGSTTTRTTYHYNKQWSTRPIDLSRFRESLHTDSGVCASLVSSTIVRKHSCGGRRSRQR